MILNSNKHNINSLVDLTNHLAALSNSKPLVIVGIDGCGGAGKSTLARKLQQSLSGVTIVHKDDFHFQSHLIIKGERTTKPIGADLDWKRLREQVLEPLSKGRAGYYQRYDWPSDQLAEWHTVPVKGIIVIEGVYSTRPELRDYYDFTIWVDTPKETRLARGVERDGEASRDWWIHHWMVDEDFYIDKCKPYEKADLVVNGTQ